MFSGCRKNNERTGWRCNYKHKFHGIKVRTAIGCRYPDTKFAVNGLTVSLARELAKDNIRVNAVAPGVTRTDMVATLPKEMTDRICAGIPLGRMGEPEDIANACLYLASDMASYVTSVKRRRYGK